MLIMLLFLLGCAWLDIRTKTIPNNVSYGMIPMGICIGIVRMGIKEMLSGLILSCIIGIILSLIRAVGGADVKISAALGAAFGTTGFLYGIAYAILLAGAAGVPVVVKHCVSRKNGIITLQRAFVPYMALGFGIVTLQICGGLIK